jgi:hypothetical protein
MARIRSIHPGLWTDEKFVSVSPFARLLFMALWTEADDNGCFEWKPITLKMRVLPVDNVNVDELLEELAGANMIRRYSMSDRVLGAVRNFGRFQSPKRPKIVFPITPEVGTYVSSRGVCTEHEPLQPTPVPPKPPDKRRSVPKKGELNGAQVASVPKKSGLAPQREDGGGRMEDGVPSLRSGRAEPRREPKDVRDELWDRGPELIELLTGKPPVAARSLLGKLLKMAKDDCAVVLAALQRAIDHRPVDPVAWLSQAVSGNRRSSEDRLAEDWGLTSFGRKVS